MERRKVLTGCDPGEGEMIKQTFMRLVLGGLFALSFTSVPASPIVAGDDVIPNSVGAFTLTIFDPFFPGGFTEKIDLMSSAAQIVHRDAQVGTTIDTEIVSLDLVGASVNVGPVTVRVGDRNDGFGGDHPQHPVPAGAPVQEGPSLGQITNVVQNPGDPGFGSGDPSSFVSGDSFFDVFFEIDTAGMTFYNRDAFRLEATIFCLPPIGSGCFGPNAYRLVGPPVDLFIRQGPNNTTGDPLVGMVGSASDHHTPIPEPVTFALMALGLAGMRLRRTRRFV